MSGFVLTLPANSFIHPANNLVSSFHVLCPVWTLSVPQGTKQTKIPVVGGLTFSQGRLTVNSQRLARFLMLKYFQSKHFSLWTIANVHKAERTVKLEPHQPMLYQSSVFHHPDRPALSKGASCHHGNVLDLCCSTW